MANGSVSVNCFRSRLTQADAAVEGEAMNITRILTLLAVMLAGPVPAYVPTAEDKLFALTPADFQLTARDRADGSSVTIDTERGFVESHGLMAADSNDNYLRAVIDKPSGKLRFQAVQIVSYSGGWRYFHTAGFEGGSTKLEIITREVAGCYGSRSSSCTLREVVAFDIPEPVLRALAATWRPRGRTIWSYRLTATANADFTGSLAPAEAAGLLRAVDAWLAKHRMPS